MLEGVIYPAIRDELRAINAAVVPLWGEEHERRPEPPPRMIFVPVDDSFGPAEGPGGNPRPILTALESSEVIIQAPSRDYAQGMRDQFLIALHRACKRASPGTSRAGRYVLGKGKFTRGTILARNGVEYRLQFSVAVPVIMRAWAELPDPGQPPGPANLPQPPLPSTYEGEQAFTYPIVPGDEVEIDADVGVRDDPPAADNVAIVINPQP